MLTFGWPTDLVDIHFPNSLLDPWYWYWPSQAPTNWTILAQDNFVPAGYRKGLFFYNIPYYPVAKILPIDTQPLNKYPPYGVSSLEAAINSGDPKAFGKFDFTDPRFWQLIIQEPPTTAAGKIFNPYTQKTNPKKLLTYNAAVQSFAQKWNFMAGEFNFFMNVNAAGVDPVTWPSYPFAVDSQFGVQPPPTNIIGPSGWVGLAENTMGNGPGNLYYYGAIDPGYFFAFLQIESVGYATTIAIGQLDRNKWDQSVFPPVRRTKKTKGSDLGAKGLSPFPYGPPGDTAFSQAAAYGG